MKMKTKMMKPKLKRTKKSGLKRIRKQKKRKFYMDLMKIYNKCFNYPHWFNKKKLVLKVILLKSLLI